MTSNGHGVSFWSGENVLESEEVLAQHSLYDD